MINTNYKYILFVQIWTVLLTISCNQRDQAKIIRKQVNDSIILSDDLFVKVDSSVTVYENVDHSWITNVFQFRKEYYMAIYHKNDDTNKFFFGNISPYYVNDKLINKVSKEGIWIEYYSDGKIKNILNYKNDSLNGFLFQFDEVGVLMNTFDMKSDTIFKKYAIILAP